MPLFERELILKIHNTVPKAILAITGGGAEVIGELLRYGHGSENVKIGTKEMFPPIDICSSKIRLGKTH